MTGDEPAGDREAALVEFQTTMQRFLEAQENIMLAYLTGGERTVRDARPVLQPRSRQRLLQSAAAVPPAQPSAHSPTATGPAIAQPPAARKHRGAAAAPAKPDRCARADPERLGHAAREWRTG